MRPGRPAALVLGAAVALLGARGALAVDWSTAQTVEVKTVEYAFEPKNLSFKQGGVYRLHLVNPGKETHEFTAPEFFAAVEMRDPKVVNADRTEIVMQPGQQKDLFFVATKAGSYKLRCSDHDWAGMTGGIAIAP